MNFEGPNHQAACCLCRGHHLITSSPSHWADEAAIRYIAALNVPEDGVVCKTCRQDIKRVLDNPSRTPRWIKTPLVHKNACCIEGCLETTFSSLQRSADEIQTAAQQFQLQIAAPTPIPAPLCKHHYHEMYNHIEPTQRHCITCGSTLRRHSTSKLCPQPQAIQHHLQQHAGFQGTIKPNHNVCPTCYKSHLYILQQHKATSRDEDLKHIISKLTKESTGSAESLDQLIQFTLNKVTIEVAEELLKRNALLLQDAHDRFCSIATACSQNLHRDTDEGISISKLCTPAFILSHLTAALQQHIQYSCTVKKFGTLLYRPGTDLVKLLTRHRHIMLKILPIIVLSTAQNFYLLFPQSYRLFPILFSKI